MKTETWYYCDRRCGYKTQDRKDMEEHERTCKFESLPVREVKVLLIIDDKPELRVKKQSFAVNCQTDRDRYLSRNIELQYADNGAYYWVCKFVATEAETEAALEQCKAKMREFLLHLAGEVDGLELKQG